MARARFDEPRVPPRISMARARAAYVGPGLDLAPHHNAAATVAIALAAPFSLALPAAATPTTRSIALIPPNARHHLVAAGPMAFVYLDAASDDHRQLQSVDLDRAHDRIVRAGAPAVSSWDVETLCAALEVPPRSAVDPRIVDALGRLDDRPQDFPRLAALAALEHLSSSRLQALFRQAVGVPFRRYRLWRRMAVVVRCMSRGQSLTQAAFEAGFASSAHLSTTFRDMFGLTPSGLVALGVRIEPEVRSADVRSGRRSGPPR